MLFRMIAFVISTLFSLSTPLSAAKQGVPKAATSEDQLALEKQVKELTNRLNKLESEAQASKTFNSKEVATTGNNLELKISGHVNRAALWHSNGKNSNTVHVDNDNAPSRINLTATGKLSEDAKVGATLEAALSSNSSENVDVHNANDGTTAFTRRKVEVFIKHQRFGNLYLGQGDMASNDTMEESDLSKTMTVAAGASVSFMAAGTQFYNATQQSKGIVDGQALTVGRVFNGADGLSRRNRIRYDTPNFYGFSLQTSHAYKGTNDDWDLALKYAGTLGETKISAQIAYLKHNSLMKTVAAGSIPTKYSQVNGSVGVLFSNGISLFTAIANRKWHLNNVNDGTVYHGKIGYQHAFFEAGLTAFALDYGEYTGMIFDSRSAFAKDKYKGKSYSASLVQFLDRIGTEVYVSYRHFQLATPSNQVANYKDIKAIMSGAKIKF